MRIAVLEAVCAGLLTEQPEPSLLREGVAMWRGLVADLLRVTHVRVETIFCRDFVPSAPFDDHATTKLHCWKTSGPAEAIVCWEAAVEEADAAIIIAPETDGLLSQLVESLPAEKRAWMSSVSAIRLCSDKWQLHQHLVQEGISTIPTTIESWTTLPTAEDFPMVVKPCDGAGSFLVRLLNSLSDWNLAKREYQQAGIRMSIRQPYVAGRSLSIAGWHGPDSIEWLPVAEQHLSDDGRLSYLGGRIPARLAETELAGLRTLAERVAASIPQLRGYVGYDIQSPTSEPRQPLLVEINPRLTSSYSGYRAAWPVSPWESWLHGRLVKPNDKLPWKPVSFDSSGQQIGSTPQA